MKKLAAIIAVLIALSSLSACGRTYEDGYAEGEHMGYGEGYLNGYFAGVEEAQNDIAFFVEDDLSSIADDIKDKFGIYPEKAMQILANYADDPEAISDEDLYKAIWALDMYFYRSREVIKGIEDYWID